MPLPSPSIPLAWPITATALNGELSAMQEIVSRWQQRFSNDEFLRELDTLPEMSRAEVFAQFINEMKLCASKSATLVEVLA